MAGNGRKFCFSGSLIGPIRRRKRHDVVGFFHCKDMEVNIIHLPFLGVAITDIFIIEVGFDGVALDELGPVSTLLDQSRSVDTFLP